MMKIYASGIKDLTVARYFAAMQVDLAGFEVNAENLPAIKAIKEWILGPLSVAEPSKEMDPMQAKKLFLESDMDFWLQPYSSLSEVEKRQIYTIPFGQMPTYPGTFVVQVNSIVNFDDFDPKVYVPTGNSFYYFDLHSISDDWLNALSGHDHFGLLIRAGIEDRPGIKSFDTIDALFEKLGY